MKIDLILESGLEVEFEPEFELENHSLTEEAIWTFSKPTSTQQLQLWEFDEDD